MDPGFFFQGKEGVQMYDTYLFFVIFRMPSLIYYRSLLNIQNILQRTIDADSEKSSIKQKKKSSDVFPWNAIYYGNGSKYKDTESFISEKL